ncbi:YegS/Rv2252/BmrU family lipid kinase [Microbacterium sp. APC 3898]|uniref:YegS/Rv2252/BmrU family lipid kinase n=1 Tax=Planococcus notacanthi TaxID=3035188 RepID=A0ABT7ZIV0_9BACL|nr:MULTISPECIES: YegS/Rv2252/BmrU family lipid kinase [Terrabacteria group]MDN3427079.1 YegS/Rv2252/BmrU family lipid kinase [Planococcus sp. APC 4016]MDN3499771.1 YegS/Rv2252/BmrU family lipid kinase [Microbacterium sp. APC 3898]
MKTVFIINPLAGNGRALKKWHRFEKTIRFPYEPIVTQFPGHAVELAAGYRHQQNVLLIGFGGDGTLREIIVGAAGAKGIIVGSVAAGSGNDFARAYGSFKDAQAIERFLERPFFRREDLGEFTDRAESQFVSSTGIGFDAQITIAVNLSAIKQKLNQLGLGKLVYFLYVIRTFLTFEKFTLSVETDGDLTVYEDVWLATVSNQPYFGGGMKISPSSKTDDGLLELTVVHHISRLKLLLVFGTVFSGAHTRFKEVSQMSSREFRLSTDKPVCRHVDGDDAGISSPNEMVVYAVSHKKWNSINIGKERG